MTPFLFWVKKEALRTKNQCINKSYNTKTISCRSFVETFFPWNILKMKKKNLIGILFPFCGFSFSVNCRLWITAIIEVSASNCFIPKFFNEGFSLCFFCNLSQTRSTRHWGRTNVGTLYFVKNILHYNLFDALSLLWESKKETKQEIHPPYYN